MTRRGLRLWVLALMPALLSGCSLLPGSSSPSSGGSGSASSSGQGGATWIVSQPGKATPSPTPTSGGTPSPGVSFGFLPLSAGDAVTAGTPTPTCSPNTFNFSKVAGVDVTPGRTSAVLSWYNVGGYNLVEFKLYAISQDLVVGSQRDIGYTTVKPLTPCGQMSATISNLSPKTHYVFSVDAVVARRSGDGTHSATVARSHSIQTL